MLLYRVLKLINMMINRKRLLFEEDDDGVDWIAVYHLGYTEFDDEPEDNELTEVIFTAPNFDTAVRYAQQYLRKMQTEEETAAEWSEAQILSVELH